MEDYGRIGENLTCVLLIALNKEWYKLQNRCVILFGFRKKNAGNEVVPSSELYLVFDQFT